MKEADTFECRYSARDVILFAVALGYGSDAQHYHDELRMIWEDHAQFDVVPTFAFALMFWAVPSQQPPLDGFLPAFPPPIMQRQGLLPLHCLQDPSALESDDISVIHTWQCIEWHTPFTLKQSPVQLHSQFTSVLPKSIGTFVNTETRITAQSTSQHICTIKSTTLLFGLDQDLVKTFHSRNSSTDRNQAASSKSITPPRIPSPKQPPDYSENLTIGINQALLYRMASGDTNAIHVDSTALPPMLLANSDETPAKPILHGLATLGMAARAVEHFVRKLCKSSDAGKMTCWRHLEARFTNPVTIGDEIQVQCWDVPQQQEHSNSRQQDVKTIVFRAVLVPSRKVVLDHGWAILTHAPTARL